MAGEQQEKDPLEELRELVAAQAASIEELKKAATPTQRREARADVKDAEDDLEKLLRKHGYEVTRADLDAMAEEKAYARFARFLERAKAETDDETDDDDETAAPADEVARKRRSKTTRRPPAPPETKSEGETEEKPPAGARGGWFRQ